MKLRVCLFAFTLCFILPGMLFTQVIGTLNPPLPALVADRIGVVAAVRGQVKIKDAAEVGRVVESGGPVYLGDIVSTDAQGQLQILLKDETTFTIGPNSSILIDTFVYDPTTDDGKVSAQILKGTFRFVTGKIAKKKPESMTVKLPVGTIGVRGTMVAGHVDGEKSMAVLLGPGPKNQMGEPAGSFLLNNTVNDQTQSTHVTGINFGSEITGVGQPPVPAFRVPDAVIDNLCNAFGAQPAQGPDGQGGPQSQPTGPNTGPYPAQMAGRMGEPGRFDLNAAFERANVSFADLGNFEKLLQLVAQNKVAQLQALAPSDATRFEQLRSLNDGPFHYEDYGVATTRAGVTYNIEANINFSTDVFGGGNSKITSATTDIGAFEFPLSNTCSTCNYNPSAFSGAAGFFYSNVANVSAGACASCAADVSIGLGNINGTVGVGDGVQNLAVVGVQLNVTIKDGPNGNVLAQIATPSKLAERQMGLADGIDN